MTTDSSSSKTKQAIRTKKLTPSRQNVAMEGQIRRQTAHHRNRQVKRAS